MASSTEEAMNPSEIDPVRLPVDGDLDLHAFHPADVKSLVREYLQLCREHGILRVRIVHGKGTGALRDTVHALLAKLPWVESYSLAPGDRGHWGATIVRLHPEHEPRVERSLGPASS